MPATALRAKVESLENSGFHIPYHQLDKQQLADQLVLQDAEADENNRAARQEAIHALEKIQLPYHYVSAEVLKETTKLKNLALLLEQKAKRFASEFFAFVVAHLPYQILRGLSLVVFGTPNIQNLISSDASKRSADSNFRRLSETLLKSDAVHQSLLKTTQAVLRLVSTPHTKEDAVLPAFLAFDPTTGLPDTRFVHRELDSLEKMHPTMNSPDGTEKTFPIKNLANGRAAHLSGRVQRDCSIISSLEKFKRAFDIFTCGLLHNIPLGRETAVVTGGAVTACLMPWPEHIEKAWEEEQNFKWTARRAIVEKCRLPSEIASHILSYAGLEVLEHKDFNDQTDTSLLGNLPKVNDALFEHFHGNGSPWMSSDIDVFFVSKTSDVTASTRLLAQMQQTLVKNRANPPFDLSSFEMIRNATVRMNRWRSHPTHWTREYPPSPDEDDIIDYWWWEAEQLSMEEYKRDNGVDPEKLKTWERDDGTQDGWTRFQRDSIMANLKYAPTVRTANSITVCGLHPVRHVQLMLPVVHSPEEFMLSFDLDCVAVCFDGKNVWVSERALRAFNTRTNFVDVGSIQDRARVSRMTKYNLRGFNTMLFEVCKHQPRCDVNVSPRIMQVFSKNFKKPVKVELANGNKPTTDELHEDIGGRASFIVQGGGDRAEIPAEVLGMDYNPAPLMYGSQVNTQDLKNQIQFYEMPNIFGEGVIMSNHVPICGRLRYELTKDVDRFAAAIQQQDPRSHLLIGMRWKSEKDAARYRRVWWAIANEMCYMCRGVLGDDHVEKPITFDDEESGGDENEEEKDDDSKNDKGKGPQRDDSSDENNESDSNADEPPSNTSGPRLRRRRVKLCQSCISLNRQKCRETADLAGKRCIVTGGRTKIGYQTALKLLRCGAHVWITTRFPLVAAEAFVNEKDSGEWIGRLGVFGVDFRDQREVKGFTDYVKSHWDRLDVLINNAAQTIRRPPQFYRLLLEREIELATNGPAHIKNLWLDQHLHSATGIAPTNTSTNLLTSPESQSQSTSLSTASSSSLSLIPFSSIQSSPSSSWITDIREQYGVSDSNLAVALSALYTQIPLPEEGSEKATKLFPVQPEKGKLEPFDLRAETSWTKRLEEVDANEVAEVLVINTFAPTLLIQQLHPLLVQSTPSEAAPQTPSPRFVINVSSSEGNFSSSAYSILAEGDFRTFTSDSIHPHTNVAKAGLNRLTQSISGDFAKWGCYVTSVDPGWVSYMKPTPTSGGGGLGTTTDGRVPGNNMVVSEVLKDPVVVVPPLREEDGAARVLDPIIQGLKGGTLWKGVLLKDFK
ncbi:hypothetical protein HK102_013796, partial [Quaeritorhiza haematococci]